MYGLPRFLVACGCDAYRVYDVPPHVQEILDKRFYCKDEVDGGRSMTSKAFGGKTHFIEELEMIAKEERA